MNRLLNHEAGRLVLHVASHADDVPSGADEVPGQVSESVRTPLERSLGDHAEDDRPPGGQRLDPGNLRKREIRSASGLDDDEPGQPVRFRTEVGDTVAGTKGRLACQPRIRQRA